jgi:hypothetical protein
MKPLLALVFILALLKTPVAFPIPQDPENECRISFPWKRYLPAAAVVAFMGTVAVITFFGTRAEEEYQAVDPLERSEEDPKFQAISPYKRNYVTRERVHSLGQEDDLDAEDKKSLELADLLHGVPPLGQVPDTSGLSRAERKGLLSGHAKVKSSSETVKEKKKYLHTAEGRSSYTQAKLWDDTVRHAAALEEANPRSQELDSETSSLILDTQSL